ncbi:MAG: glycosyltransferase family 4 protein [Verrucomicrobiota bacterium]
MKIAFVLYDYITLGERSDSCLRIAQELLQRKHQVLIFTRTWQGLFPKGIDVHLLGRVGRTKASQNLHFLESLEEALAENAVDAIIAFDPIPHCDIYFLRDDTEATLSRAERKNEKLLFKQSPAPSVFCITNDQIVHCREVYKSAGSDFLLRPANIKQVTRSDEEKERTRSELRSEYSIPDGRSIALYLTSQLKEEGLDRCLGALASCSAEQDTELWVIGGGDPGKYAQETTQNALKVRFLGGRQDIERFYDAVDVLLHPCMDAPIDRALIEAIIYGLPVISIPEVRYLSHLQASKAAKILKTPFDQNELNETLSSLINNRSLHTQLSQSALEYAENEELYNSDRKITDQILEILSPKSDSGK